MVDGTEGAEKGSKKVSENAESRDDTTADKVYEEVAAESKGEEMKKDEGAKSCCSCCSSCCSGKIKSLPHAAIVLIGVLVLGVLLLFMNGSHLSKKSVEALASESLGVDVTIEEMRYEPKEKRVTITGLKIANPEGFDSPYLLETGKVVVEGKSFSKKEVVFSNIVFSDSFIYLDINQETTNLSAMADNVKKEDDGNKKKSKKKKKSKYPGIVVENLVFESAKLMPSQGLQKLGLKVVSLPDISGGIGQEGDGVTPEEVIDGVMRAVIRVSAQRTSGSSMLFSDLLEKSLDSLSEFKFDRGTLEQIEKSLETFIK